MEEQYITFETAKLAKEKGCKNSLGLTPLAFDCTQASLQKWLREVHNIHIQIIFLPINSRFIFAIYKYGKEDIESVLEYETYELALEEGIKQALNLIK